MVAAKQNVGRRKLYPQPIGIIRGLSNSAISVWKELLCKGKELWNFK